MDIRQIKYFSEVYETLNYTHAAQRLYVSRQAIKQTVNGVEREMGKPLFVADGNKIVATKAAKALYESSRALFREYEVFEQSLLRMKGKERNEFIVGMYPSMDFSYTATEVKTLRGQLKDYFPQDVKNCITWAESEALKQMVVDRVLDCAFVLDALDDSRFRSRTMRKGRLFLYVGNAHFLADRRSVTISCLDKLEMVSQRDEKAIVNFVLSKCSSNGIEPKIRFICPTMAEVVGCLVSDPVAAIGYVDVSNDVRFDGVVAIPFEEEFMIWSECLITRRNDITGDRITELFGRRIEGISSLAIDSCSK